jgi:nicotinate-nucleotide adenylyltransferase
MDTSGNKVIGIYGGSFDPIHYGHLRTAAEVKALFGLDQLRLMPCYQSPLKQETRASAADRVAMLQLAIAEQTDWLCETCEIDRQGPSYMVETLATLKADLASSTLMVFIGMDAFNQLTHWYRWQQLFNYAHLVVMTRPGIKPNNLDDFLANRLVSHAAALKTSTAGQLFFQTVTPLDISATTIRSLFFNHGNARFLLPDSVIAYINAHNLYRTI